VSLMIPLAYDERIEFVGRGHAGKEPVALARRLAPEVIAMASACRGWTGSMRHAGSRRHSPGHGSPSSTGQDSTTGPLDVGTEAGPRVKICGHVTGPGEWT
jgi:hypothetical protein